VEPVDLRHPDGGEEPRDRQQVRVRERDGRARDDVREEVQAEEDARVGQRAGRDDRLSGDVDAREADRGESADADQSQELSVTKAYGGISSS